MAQKIKYFFQNHLFVFKIAAITALAMIAFEVINLFVLYGYVKLDIYATIVAISFLVTGIIMARQSNKKAIITDTPNYLLTAREKQILSIVAEGKTNKEIAAILFIEISTVKTHINNIYTKLAVKTREDARLKYLEMPQNG